MNEWNWNGARWWKFDFHAHTPKSDDYGKNSPQQTELKARSPREWLLDYMRAGVDCVAITDHNSGAWIDALKQELEALNRVQPEGYRSLHLFPGVELSVHGGIHMLAIFGPATATSDIDTLLGAVGFPCASKGKSDAVTTKAFSDVAAEITRAGGIAIPAHVDNANGILQELQGLTLQQALDCKHIFAMELVNPSYLKPQAYESSKLNWTEVIGSDAHHPSGRPGENYPGSRFTWIKMGTPSIEGLRLALLDGALSVIRSDLTSANPNDHAEMVIESVEIDKAKYMGRPSAFSVPLNPWMNAIIGGRGTGKSTLVEFIRIAMRRENELSGDLKKDFEKYRQMYANREDSGLLTPESIIRVVYRKNGIRYRIQWSADGNLEPIEEQQEGGWQKSEGDIPQRFPVRMYSQKQVFQLAKEPLALMRIVNDAPEVGYKEWRREVEAEENKFLALRTKAREINAGLSDEPRLKGELEDITRKLAVFEKGHHADLYKALQTRKRQENALESWEANVSQVGATLRSIAGKIEPENIDESVFDSSKPEDVAILEQARRVSVLMAGFAINVKKMADEADGLVAAWQAEKKASEWRKAVDQAVAAYGELEKRMAGEGIADSSAYGLLVQRRQSIERQLKEFAGRREQITKINEQAVECLVRIKDARHVITQKREGLFTQVLRDNRLVRIGVIPYGAKETVVEEFRALIQRPDGGFDKDIGEPGLDGWLGNLYDGEPCPDVFEQRLMSLKETVRKIAASPQQADVADRRFAAHLAKLPPEAMDRLDLWFPEDSLAVEYCNPSDGHTFRPIHEGSPGQKTAALLAFLLTYGHEPLILDQPEDDLDNHHIYGLIVGQLREIKRKRQVIVVTHNANIVVNGDAELVVALAARGGQTQQEASGCLQNKIVRQTICEVMEGGEKAFEQRYRRIALEVHHV